MREETGVGGVKELLLKGWRSWKGSAGVRTGVGEVVQVLKGFWRNR